MPPSFQLSDDQLLFASSSSKIHTRRPLVYPAVSYNSFFRVFVLSVSREFPGDGYLKYDILKPKNEAINSDVDTLSLQFRTIQPTGLLFHTQNSGDQLGDHVTLELVSGRLRYVLIYSVHVHVESNVVQSLLICLQQETIFQIHVPCHGVH